MTDYCLFTITHRDAKRIYIRGVADVTEPIDEYENIIEFYDGNELKGGLPPNPYEVGTEEHRLFGELLTAIESDFEGLGDGLVFVTDEDEYLDFNHKIFEIYVLDMDKVVI